jgi:hypothetical protein
MALSTVADGWVVSQGRCSQENSIIHGFHAHFKFVSLFLLMLGQNRVPHFLFCCISQLVRQTAQKNINLTQVCDVRYMNIMLDCPL